MLKEINLECSLEGLMLKLKLQYFGHLMQRANPLEKTLMLGKTEGRRRRGWQIIRWLDGIPNSMDISLSKPQKMVKDREAWGATVHEVTKSQTRLCDWTTKAALVIKNLPANAGDLRGIDVEMVGWHHWLNGHEFEQTQGDSEGQGSLACSTGWQRVGHNWVSEQQQLTNKLMMVIPRWLGG